MIELEVMSRQDLEYLYSLCEATMRTYTETVWGCWNEPEIRKHFADSLSKEMFECILENGDRVGALSIESHEGYFQLEQIYIEPSHQNRGIGGEVVKTLIARAKKEVILIRIRVLKPNPAKRFYERLGFVVSETTAQRYHMEYKV